VLRDDKDVEPLAGSANAHRCVTGKHLHPSGEMAHLVRHVEDLLVGVRGPVSRTLREYQL
jgi:hypothetical protein